MRITHRALFSHYGQRRARPTKHHTPNRPFPTASYGATATQAYRYCPPCGTETAAVLHGYGHTCGDCGNTHYTEEGAE